MVNHPALGDNPWKSPCSPSKFVEDLPDSAWNSLSPWQLVAVWIDLRASGKQLDFVTDRDINNNMSNENGFHKKKIREFREWTLWNSSSLLMWRSSCSSGTRVMTMTKPNKHSYSTIHSSRNREPKGTLRSMLIYDLLLQAIGTDSYTIIKYTETLAIPISTAKSCF